MHVIRMETRKRKQFVDVTDRVASIVKDSRITEGACLVYCPHTTAGLVINEGADPDVMEDIMNVLDKTVKGMEFRHVEGNSDAHAKSVITGCSVVVPVRDGRLLLGTWQKIFFLEFDGPRNREILVTLLKTE